MNWAVKWDMAIPNPIRVISRGVGQVFFCCNAVTGIVFLTALYIGGLTAGLAATLGVITSTLTAYVLGFSEDDIEAGLYGFNGTLVGPCLFLFLENTPQLWLYVVLASILSSIILAAMIRVLTSYNIPASTSPFVLTSWIFLAAVYSFDKFSPSPILPTPDIPAELASIDAASIFTSLSLDNTNSWYEVLSKGLAQVMFADKVIVGVLFLLGIAITSARGAFMALCGAIVGVVLPICLGASQFLTEMGLYAFNSVLTMMAIGWVFLKPTTGTAILAFLAGCLTVICQAAITTFLSPVGLPTLTFPFVLVMWMFLFAAGISRHWAPESA